MKLLKYILLFLFPVILVGLCGKTILPFKYAGLIFFFSMLAYLIGSMVYIMMALINKKHRIEAAMMGIPLLLLIGILFTFMRWPFGGPFTVVGSGTTLMFSIGLFIYILIQNRKVALGALYAATGFSSFYFCFKIMLWPGASSLFIISVVAMLAAIGIILVKKQNLTSAMLVLLIINGFVFSTIFASKSRIYCYKHLNTINPGINYHEDYYTFAWMLYQEGKTEEAKTNLQLAIQQIQNPNNKSIRYREEDPKAALQRYERAMVLLNSNNWKEKEKSPDGPY